MPSNPKDFYNDLGYGAMSFIVTRPVPETPLQKAERELADLKAMNERQAGELRRIAKAGHVTGIVMMVRKDTVVVAVGPQFAETLKPEFLPKGVVLEPGCGVRIQQPNLQIVDVVDPMPVGTVHEVIRLLPGGMAEITSQPTPRAVLCPEKLKVRERDRVVVDATMIVVLQNLGRAGGNKYAVQGGTGVSWEDVLGQEHAVLAMQEAIEGSVLDSDLYQELGKRASKGVLLHGVPGVGKSLIAKAAATAVAKLHGSKGDASGYCYIKSPEIVNKYLGQSEENVREIFIGARNHFEEHGYPQVVFLDEAESILGSRSKREGKSSVDLNVVQMFLAELDGLKSAGAFFILATNRPQDLDPAIVREGRIDTKIELRRPTKEAARAIALHNLKDTKTVSGAEETAAHLAEELFSSRHVLGMATERHSKNKERVLLSHTASGALVVGIVEAAKQIAIRRVKAGDSTRAITFVDVKHAVEAKHVEALGMGHHEIAAEVVGGFEKLASFEATRRVV